jgi:hypothetical protein
MAVDVEEYNEHSVAELAAARRQLSSLLADMCDSPGFDQLLLCKQSAGDGEVVLLPVGIDEPRTATLLVNWLVRALHPPSANRRMVRETALAVRNIEPSAATPKRSSDGVSAARD